ncbi:lycopene cyclase domain-containing protein [Saccharothrix tamanrassetensis]|uniref:Lycopene cyclase domain-containing protein n=1 Tax=Saccharothrix tamanrassetensis TaxID=1051531 RepID=A0A841CLR4_9PSEU|nr:lycopene cyclase domain-containing protein [Saccharothrix tamanrassetensis]MBB5957037.1 lycopene cyclase domain-containing protein [Saccharothrix tamanrassetensis]
MERWQYLAVLAACLAVTLPLEFMGSGVYRRFRRLVRTIVPVMAVFAVWDLVAIARGHWTFNEEFTTGVVLPGGMPLEEVLFFVVVPLCGLLTYEGVRAVLQRRKPGRSARSAEESRAGSGYPRG